jgi:hypothetical protein
VNEPRAIGQHILPALACALVSLLAVFGYVIWKRSPRQQSGYSFVQVGPSEGASAKVGLDWFLNLPMSSFACAPVREGGATLCTRRLEGQELQVRFNAAACGAEYAGASVPCGHGIAYRGMVEHTLRIEDDLGLTPARRRALQQEDFLSHASEGDWGLATWFVGLTVASLFAAAAHALLRKRRQVWRAVLTSVAFAVGLPLGVLSMIVTLVLMGYAD